MKLIHMSFNFWTMIAKRYMIFQIIEIYLYILIYKIDHSKQADK